MLTAAIPLALSRARLGAAMRVVIAAIAFLVTLSARPALAFTPPQLIGHVVDTSGKLGPDDIRYLDAKLDRMRRKTGFEVVAFVAGSLEGEPIEDVAYTAFNTWQIGRKGEDNGVLLVIAPAERRVRIETGKGVGGALTDLQSNDILRRVVNPLLKQDRLRDAIDKGSDAIVQALVAGSDGAPPNANVPPPRGKQLSPIAALGLVAAFVMTIVLAIVSPAFRMFLWFALQMLLLGGGRGGGGGDGSGYRGGGGRSGGGGSSDSY